MFNATCPECGRNHEIDGERTDVEERDDTLYCICHVCAAEQRMEYQHSQTTTDTALAPRQRAGGAKTRG
jgi:hypothetical protein